jgi:hypothetical protein
MLPSLTNFSAASAADRTSDESAGGKPAGIKIIVVSGRLMQKNLDLPPHSRFSASHSMPGK